jgi:hypothetical protein
VTYRSFAVAGVLLAVSGGYSPVQADAGGSALSGWVEDLKGEPIPGALISLFGKGVKASGLIAFSDASGHFVLSALPAGSYTLRALERSYLPSPPHHVTIVAGRDTLLSLSLAPLMEQLTKAEAAERSRELDWLMRHKRRSVLEGREGGTTGEGSADGSSRAAVAMAGDVELMTSPGTFGAFENPGFSGAPVNWSVIRLRGQIPSGGEWAVSGLLSDDQRSNWRMAGEFSGEPWEGHAVRVGTGYGTWVPHPLFTGDSVVIGAGSAFVEDRWSLSDSVTATLGARYSYIGFVTDRNHVDPRVALQGETPDGSRFQASFHAITVAPGGDVVGVFAQAPSSALAFAATDPELRPERVLRFSLGASHPFGATSVGLRLLQETESDQFLNHFDRADAPQVLLITNGRELQVRGVGVSLSRQIAKSLAASVSYTYGQAWRSEAGMDPGLFVSFKDARFQDVACRLEAMLDASETRLVALYRVNALRSGTEGVSSGPVVSTRFDVEIRQGLPFLGALTRADWELLVAMRNLFYTDDEAGLLDEFAVVNPPKRVLGGIAVRF